MNKRKEEKREFTVVVGILLKDILDKQKAKIREATYDCVNPSYYEAGEILAKKIIANKIL
jgi:hypothetical protein